MAYLDYQIKNKNQSLIARQMRSFMNDPEGARVMLPIYAMTLFSKWRRCQYSVACGDKILYLSYTEHYACEGLLNKEQIPGSEMDMFTNLL